MSFALDNGASISGIYTVQVFLHPLHLNITAHSVGGSMMVSLMFYLTVFFPDLRGHGGRAPESD